MPRLEGPIIPSNGGVAKPPLHLPYKLPLLGGPCFGRIFCLKSLSKIKKMKMCMQNCSSWSISHSWQYIYIYVYIYIYIYVSIYTYIYYIYIYIYVCLYTRSAYGAFRRQWSRAKLSSKRWSGSEWEISGARAVISSAQSSRLLQNGSKSGVGWAKVRSPKQIASAT